MDTVFAATVTDQTATATGNVANLLQGIITKVPLWIAAIFLLVMSVLVAKVARRVVENKLAENGIEAEHQELQILGGRIAYTTILILGVTVSLNVAGIDLTTIIAAVAFGIGFALKDLIMNFLAGIMILISRHFTIGDFINIGGTVGKVVEIQSRVTILQAINGTKVIVPNAEIFKKQVTSYTSNPFRRIDISVCVDYRHDLANVIRLCQEALKNTTGILPTPAPSVLVKEFGDNGVILKIKGWVESRGGWLKIKSNLAFNVKNILNQHGVRIAWPIYMNIEDTDNPIQERQFVPAPQPVAPIAPAVPVVAVPVQDVQIQ